MSCSSYMKKWLPNRDVTPSVLATKAGKIQKNNKNKNKKPKADAKGKNHGNGKANLDYAPKATIPPPPKKEHTAKEELSCLPSRVYEEEE
ncbi:hypothetical protein Tco_1511261 [Tanacetum coccineum]